MSDAGHRAMPRRRLGAVQGGLPAEADRAEHEQRGGDTDHGDRSFGAGVGLAHDEQPGDGGGQHRAPVGHGRALVLQPAVGLWRRHSRATSTKATTATSSSPAATTGTRPAGGSGSPRRTARWMPTHRR